VHVLTVNISSKTCTVWNTICDISRDYRVERNIYCYVGNIPLLLWVPEDGPSVSKHVAVYISVTNGCITDCIYWTIYWLFFNLARFTVPIQLPPINIGPPLYMMSPTHSHFVLPIVQCSAAVFMFVTCGIGRCDEFTGCAELRLDIVVPTGAWGWSSTKLSPDGHGGRRILSSQF